jgi:hypothetical protein
MPQVSINPPPPTSTAPTGSMPVIAVTKTEGATLRYTLDGSRPSEASPVVPAKGILFDWPAAAVAINVRGFKAGYKPSVTNGFIFELNYDQSRQDIGGHGHPGLGAAGGVLDSIICPSSSGGALVRGWAVDACAALLGPAELHTSCPRSFDPVAVTIRVDGALVAAAVADKSRPDLPKAKVAPNAEHGFTVTLGENATRALCSGRHAVEAHVVGSPSSEQPWQLNASPMCVCEGKACACE